jgi:hypothetical protein
VIITPEHRWSCPNCPQEHVTHEARPHTPFHACRGLKGLTAPFVAAGTRAKVETREREDYIGTENVTTDGDERPIMAVITTRDDGTDCAVMAPSATTGATGEDI